MIFVDFGVPSLDMHPFKSKCWLEKNKIQDKLTKITTLVAQIMNPGFSHGKILCFPIQILSFYLINHKQKLFFFRVGISGKKLKFPHDSPRIPSQLQTYEARFFGATLMASHHCCGEPLPFSGHSLMGIGDGVER